MIRFAQKAQPITALCALLLCGGTALAQTPATDGPEPTRVSLLGEPSRYVNDFKGFMTSPAGWTGREWALLGGVLAATSVAYQYDYDVREHFVPEPRPKDYHDVEDVIPAALVFGATWFAARRTGDDARFGEATTMVRAAALSTVSSLVFKLGLGRERPAEGVERDDWWSGGRSMPSGHTALGFAVGTVLAESGTPKHRWVRRVAGYSLGVGTAYLRLKHDSHWFSDTIPGAALGMAAAHYAMSHVVTEKPRASYFVAPLDGGALLSFSVPLNR